MELTSDIIRVDDDPVALYELSLRNGWGDGLPILPATEGVVRALIAATPYASDDVICILPPGNGVATIEKAAINAAMAGVEPRAFRYVVAALEAIAVPQFNAFALTTTTSSVTPVLIVNGPSRVQLGFDMGPGCMGGAAGRGSMTVGRAVQLCLRNIGGQRVGVSSKSVFGQPARAGGLCFAEWEEVSPWPSLAQQRGFRPDEDVLTVHGSKGTMPIADTHNDDVRDLLHLIAKSVAYPLSNKQLDITAEHGQVVLVLNPIWAERFGRAFPDIHDLRQFLWEHAWLPIDSWPPGGRAFLEKHGRVDEGGRVRVNARPDQFIVVVCGGQGSLHAINLPSFGESELQSRAVAAASSFS